MRGEYDRGRTEIRFAMVGLDGEGKKVWKANADDCGEEFMMKGGWGSVENPGKYGKFKLKGVLAHGPNLKKKIWWNWGANHGMNVTWDGWYTKDSDKKATKYAQQLRNMQITFFDHIISGAGEDHLGSYTISGDFGTHKSIRKTDTIGDDDSKSVAMSDKTQKSNTL